MINPRFHVKRLLGQFGLEIRRVPKSGLEKPSWLTHPVTADYLPEHRGSLITAVNIDDARGLHVAGFPFTIEHPFVRAAIAGKAEDCEAWSRTSIRASLTESYRAYQPHNALEAVRLSAADAPGLVGQPVHACLVPWSSRDVAETVKGRSIAMREAGLQYGISISLDDGLTVFGPATDTKVALETSRIADLVSSVKTDGFRPFDSHHPLKACALMSDVGTRWQIEEGHHRIPVAAAFGIKTLQVMVTKIVRRADAPYWPRVADGTFTARGATKMFDRIFGPKAEE